MVAILTYVLDLFRTRTSRRPRQETSSDNEPLDDAAVTMMDHNDGCNCPTGYCNCHLISLEEAIRNKESEVKELERQLDLLRQRRPRMTISHIKDNSEKV